MAIQQSKKQSDLEKRLQLLRKQVYGRESVVSSKHSFPSANAERKYQVVKEEKTLENTHTTNYQLPTTDITHLHQDLLKIMTFSSLAIGVQLLLFFLLKNHILSLNFL